jgi:pimeloyl-ACP methyl ester carboxylesterase
MSQVSALSKDRPVLVYEAAGQGLQPFDSSNLTLPRQAELLHQTLQEIFPDSQFNIAGFSLGGRIAMAFAVLYPNLVNKLVVTGVSVEPSLAGIVALESWKHLLSSNNIDGFAWSILQTTYSPNFLRKNLHRLPQWVNMICENNSAEGLLELLSQTRALPEWSISTMSERLTMLDKCLILGELDIMAPLPLEDWNTVHIVPDCGHAVPTEQPLEWRRLVLDFLAKD